MAAFPIDRMFPVKPNAVLKLRSVLVPPLTFGPKLISPVTAVVAAALLMNVPA
jgi:hypothetical protein